MLPPFRIRHLRASDNPSGPDLGDDFLSSPIDRDEDAVVAISEAEYDSLISRHPEAVLSYLDDDDGEIITVGSSYELAQRLEEPPLGVTPTATSMRSPSPSFLYPSHARSADPHLSTVSAPMQIFDVDRSSGAIEIWKRMIITSQHRDRQVSSTSSTSKGKQRAIQSLAWEDSIPERPTNDLEVEVDESDNLCRESELNRERELDDHTFHAQVNDVWTTQSHDPSIAELEGRNLEPEQDELARETTPLLRNYTLSPYAMTDDATSLTSERRRQAREAGGKLRLSLRNSWSSHPISSEGEKEVHRDRWASYGRTPSSISGPSAPHNADRSMEPKTNLTEDRPLLDVFEDELQEVMNGAKPSSVTDEKLPAEQTSFSPSTLPVEDHSNGSSNGSPGELFTHTLRSLVDGVGLLAADLRSGLSEVHEPAASVPQTVHRALQAAFAGFGSHIQGLANVAQDASHLARTAADRTREADVQALEGTVQGLRSLAVGVGEFSRGLFSAPPTRPTKVSSVHDLLNNGDGPEVMLGKEGESPKLAPVEADDLRQAETHQDGTPQPVPERSAGLFEASAATRYSTPIRADEPPKATDDQRTPRQVGVNTFEAPASALGGTLGTNQMATGEAQIAAIQLHRETYNAAAAQARKTAEDARRAAVAGALRARTASQRAAGVARRDAIESAMIARRFALQNARSVREVISQNNGIRIDTSPGSTNAAGQGESSKGREREETARLAREEMSRRRRQLRRLAIRDARPDRLRDERGNVEDEIEEPSDPESPSENHKITDNNRSDCPGEILPSVVPNPGSDSEVSTNDWYKETRYRKGRPLRDVLPYSRHGGCQHGRFYRPRHSVGYEYVSPSSAEQEEHATCPAPGSRSPGSPLAENCGRLDRRPLSPALPRQPRSVSPPIHRRPVSPPRHRFPPHRHSPPPGWPCFPRHGPIHLPHDLPRHPRSAYPPPPPPPPPPPAEFPRPPPPSSPLPWSCPPPPPSPPHSGSYPPPPPPPPPPSMRLHRPSVGHRSDQDRSELPRAPLRHRQSWHPGPPPLNANPWNYSVPFGARRGDEMRSAKPFVSFADLSNIPAQTEISSRSGDMDNSRGLKHRRSFAGPYSRGMGRSQENRFSSGPRWSGVFPSGDGDHDTIDKLEPTKMKRQHTQLGETSDDEVDNHGTKNSWRYERLEEELDRPSKALDERRRPTEPETLKNDNNGEETENDESLLLPRPVSNPRSWPISSPLPQPLLLPPRESGASPIPEMTRFPSLSQFEGSSFQRPQTFPALPSMATLTPQNRDLESTGSSLRSTNPFATPPPQLEQHQQDEHSYLNTIPGAWPPPPPPPQASYQAQNLDAATSSPSSNLSLNQRLDEISRHQPILRAWLDHHLQYPHPTEAEKQALQLRTGLNLFQISNWFDTARTLLGLNNTSPQAQPAQHARPLDPPALPDASESRTPFGGPHRAATTSEAHSHSARSDQEDSGPLRRWTVREGGRPYSEHYTGHGRLGWSTYLDNSSSRNPVNVPYPSTPPELAAPANGETTDHQIDEPMIDLEDATDNCGPEDDIQKCVGLLKSLGFGTEEDGGMERLSVYAVAADGDLETALEIISEEKRAWQERC